jgi:hypothetical protein
MFKILILGYITLTRYSQIFINFLLLSPIGFILFLYGNIGTYNRLLGDGLCSFYYAERLGLFRSIWYWRITWSGRYSAYAFDWLTEIFFNAQNIVWFTPIILIAWIVASVITVYLFLKSKSLSLILGPACVFLILTLIPTIEQSFYWVDGFRAYTLPVIILTTYFMLYLMWIDKIKSKPSIIWSCIIAFCLFFASGGLSETFAVFQVCLLAFVIGYYWIIEKPNLLGKNIFIFFSSLLGSILATLVVASAYGNVVRQSFFPPAPNIFTILSISFESYIKFLTNIFVSPEKITALIGVLVLSFWIGSVYQGKLTRHRNKIIFQALGGILLSFACFPPGVYGYSEPPPGRVLSIAIFILVIGFMSASFLIGNLLKPQKKNILILFSILFISTSAWVNGNLLFQKRIVFMEYAQTWDATDLLIKQAITDKKDVVEVPTDSSWAGLDILNQNKNHWVNECYSAFYGIQVFGAP